MMEGTTEVTERALSITDQAMAVVITTPETYVSAGSLWKSIKDTMKEISDTFDPIIDQAHKAHKKALEQKAKYYKPLDEASRKVKGLMSAYDAEQERIRLEKERALAEQARKEEEERRLAEAIAAEEEAKRNGATPEEATKEAEAVLDEPAYVPPVVVPKAVPKMEGGPVYRTVWSAEVVDIKALCRAVAEGSASTEFVTANMPALNKMATALKDTMNIPGVKATSRRV